MIALALRSGVPMSEWEQAGPRSIRTAFDIYQQWDRPPDTDNGVVMGG